ncbi:K(lysine) acetyltransferase [Rhizophlyctis rosea]|nr:K(lysine) acetyltransferase [Rhizophlyctis rosea]
MKRKFDEMNFQKVDQDASIIIALGHISKPVNTQHKPMNPQQLSEIDPKLESLEREREEITKVRNIDNLQFGKYIMKTWYFSPYPDEYKELSTIYVCEFCLKYMRLPESLLHHKPCKFKRPPGKVIYEKDTLRVYEVDGKEDKLYCQNLCLLSKLFLDHKTVYYDIEPFMFYILTETERLRNREVDHIVGYFSKEKLSYDDYNLACILTLPPHQRKGYGRFLIEFSYEISKVDGKVGSPERPLSDLGLAGYRSYWQAALLDILQHNARDEHPTIAELSALTSIRQEDIVSTLSTMDMIRYFKGDNVICVTPSMVKNYIRDNAVKLERSVDPICINYTPRPRTAADNQLLKRRALA